MVLLILALAGLQVVKHSQSLSVLFALDFSDSVSQENREFALNYIKQAINTMKLSDTAGLIVFGSDAYVELPPSLKPKISKIYSVPSTRFTDISEAIRLAQVTFPSRAQKKLVLLTDGNENKGLAIEEAKVAQTNDIEIDIVPLPSSYKTEVLAEKMVMPSEVKEGEVFEIKVVANARQNCSGVLKLFRNGYYIGEQAVKLVKGKNIFVFNQSIKEPGFYTYQATLESPMDTIKENNKALGFCLVKGKPKILFIESEPSQAHYLARALKSKDIQVETRFPYNIPTNLAEWQSYDAVILSDLPSVYLSQEQINMIATNCRDLGIGLIMLGGENSFGLGGYYKTPIEDALPVSMDIRKRREFPSLALMLVIDKSGSMGEGGLGYQKVDLAKKAAIAAVELLDERDMIGVVCFDTAYKWVVNLQYVKNKGAIENTIATVVAGGGTDMYPAQEAAYEALKGAKARLKHTILLTDGMTHPRDFYKLTTAMVRDNITISTVAVGTDADVNLLRQIAQWGKGRFYYTDDPHNIPQIFTKETVLASKSAIVEEPFVPRVNPAGEILRGIDWRGVPPLLGYVVTTRKPIAEMLMVSHKNDPIFASWRYGLGKSVAFTSDVKARWGAHWVSWPNYGKLWSQAVRWALRKSAAANFQTSVDLKHNKVQISVDAFDEKGEFLNFMEVKANVITPNMRSITLSLEQTAPGRYQGEFEADEIGSYMIALSEKRSDGIILSQTAGLAIPYSPEYKNLEVNQFLLSRIAEITGGRILKAPQEAFQRSKKAARMPQDIWSLLVLLAVLLFPMDVAIRRLIIGYQEVLVWKSKLVALLVKLIERRPKPVPEPTTVARIAERVKIKPKEAVAEMPKLVKEKPAEKIEPPPKPVEKREEIQEAEEESFVERLLKVKKRRNKMQ